MLTTHTAARPLLAVLLTGFLAACGGAADEPPAANDASPGMAMDGMEAHDMGAMAMDSAMMRRHVQEMDSMRLAMRQHVQTMRQLSPEERQSRMPEHAAHVGGMMGMMDSRMREMGMGMGGDHQMMGMSAEDHQRMMAEMQALRAEAEQLRTAPPADVRERMPAHLDRLERMTEMMERAGTHLHEP